MLGEQWRSSRYHLCCGQGIHQEITDVRKEIGEVRKEITTQTRWILAVMVGATVLIPVLQRVMAWLLP